MDGQPSALTGRECIEMVLERQGGVQKQLKLRT